MSIDPSAPRLEPETAWLSLGDGYSDPVAPADFPETVLRFRNQRWAERVGLGGLSDAEWITHFGRFMAIAGSLPRPQALRYHGHQFRVYNPDIGDGRGFLFAQLRDGPVDDPASRLLDFGTKGSGTTPYSRSGDGRLTLKGGVREILATEMLEALGVTTSKTFSIIETGEALMRGDEPSPTRSAVMVRLSHSHVRIGAFQRLAAEGDDTRIARLVEYVLRKLYRVEPEADPAAQLLGLVVERTADLAGSYMVAGFVHGVLNSDNINVTGESFDYGPWRFTPQWDAQFTAAYFDHQGLYAFGRQAEAIHWDVAQLAMAMRGLTETEPLVAQLERFGDIYARALVRRFLWRLGVAPADHEVASPFVQAAVKAMIETGTPIDRFFHDWRGIAPQGYDMVEWASVHEQLGQFTAVPDARTDPYWSGEPCSMHIAEVEAIWSAIAQHDDWQPLHDKVAAIRAMGRALAASGKIG